MEQSFIYSLPLDVFASSSAAIAAAALFLLIVSLLEHVEIDKEVDANLKELPIFFKIFMPFTPVVVRMIDSDSFAPSKDQAKNLLLMAGYEQTISPEQFLAVRYIMIAVGVMFIPLSLVVKQPLMGFTVALLMFAYPNIWLKNTVKRRHLDIQKALPTVLDLLTLSIEAGKDFITALRDILGRRRTDALGEELGRTLQEIQLGKQRRQALKDLGNRVQQSDLTSVINSIIQADELGVSIGQLLRIQGDQLRGKRFQRAEKLANEAPVKILFPVIIFIFPSVIIMLMGPIVMQAFQSLLM